MNLQEYICSKQVWKPAAIVCTNIKAITNWVQTGQLYFLIFVAVIFTLSARLATFVQPSMTNLSTCDTDTKIIGQLSNPTMLWLNFRAGMPRPILKHEFFNPPNEINFL